MKGMEEMCNALSTLSHENGVDFILVGVIYDEKQEKLQVAVGSNVTNQQVRSEAIQLAVDSLEGEPDRITHIH